MKYFTFYLLLIIFFLTAKLPAQEISFQILFESNGDEEASLFKLDHQENFVGLLTKAPPDTGNGYIYHSCLYRISQQGDTMSISFVKEDTNFVFRGISLIKTNPSGFLLWGDGIKKGESKDNDRFTVFLRLNNDLEVLWEEIYTFDYSYGYVYAEAMELENGDLLYSCFPGVFPKMFLVRLSPDGDSLDFREYTGDSVGRIIDLSYNYDSTEIMLSTLYAHYISGGSLSSVIHLNDSLEQTEISYYPVGLESPYNVLPYPESKWLVGGSYDWWTNPPLMFQRQICAYLLDSNFNILHQVHLTDPDTMSRGAESTSIDYYDPSCIYLGGNHNLQGTIQGHEPSWFYVARLNDTLGLEYEKYVGGDDYYWLYSVNAAPDGGVMVSGTRTDYTDPIFQRDAYLIKFDSTGFPVSVPEESDIRITDAILYPNPGGDYLKVRTALKNCRLYLLDINGREVLSAPLTDHITNVSTASLPAGSYPYKVVQDKKEIISGIWIKK